MLTTFRQYPSLVALKDCPEIFSVKQVVATEKLHGSNLRLWFPPGMADIREIQYGSRTEEFGTGDSGSFHGGRPVAWFKSRPELLTKTFDAFVSRRFSDVTLFGEICGTGSHKGVRYAAPGEVFFRAFDIMVADNFVTYDLFVEICDQIGLPRCPEVWRGEPTVENFDALLEQRSHEGLANGISDAGNLAEGVVIRSNPLLRDTFGQYLIVKHKSAKFKEVSEGPRAEVVAGNADVAETFAKTYVTGGRLMNALGRLADTGVEIKHHMSDMRVLVPAVTADVLKEAGTAWKETTEAGATEAQIKKAIQGVTGAVYRAMLALDAGSPPT